MDRSIYEFPGIFRRVHMEAPGDIEREVQFLQEVWRHHLKRPVRRVLDIACGNSPHGQILARAGIAVAGIDRSPTMIAAGRAEAAGLKHLRFYRRRIEQFQIPEKSFDTALFMSETFPIITRNPDIITHLESVAALLKRGGLYCIDVDYQGGVELVGTRTLWRERTVQAGDAQVEVREYHRPIGWHQAMHSIYELECTIHFNDYSVTTRDVIPVRYITPPIMDLTARASGKFQMLTAYADLSLTRPIEHLLRKVVGCAGPVIGSHQRNRECCFSVATKVHKEAAMLVESRDAGDGVRVLMLNRPPANAINAEFLEALGAQCRAAQQDDAVRAVIVAGNGEFFSGGLDLKEASSGTSRVGNLAGSQDDGLFMLWTLPKPTIAMVNGHAIAGGVIIALACDFRIAHSDSQRFGLNEVAIGLPFPRGAFEIARLALGNQQLRWTILEAGLFDAGRAMHLGIVDEVVEPARLEARCIELARRLGANGRLAYAHTKGQIQNEAVARVLNQDPDATRQLARITQSEETRALIAAQVSTLSRR